MNIWPCALTIDLGCNKSPGSPPAGRYSVSPTQLQSLTEIILLPEPTRASCPNYLSRFSVFNENSCGNSVSIKQVKEKQEGNNSCLARTFWQLCNKIYLERRLMLQKRLESTLSEHFSQKPLRAHVAGGSVLCAGQVVLVPMVWPSVRQWEARLVHTGSDTSGAANQRGQPAPR